MAILQWIGKFILTFLLEKIGVVLKDAFDRFRRKKKAEDESKESLDPLKKAQTGEEIDEAARDALDKL